MRLDLEGGSGDPVREQGGMDRLMGIAVLAEKLAAHAYAQLAELRPEESALLLRFAHAETQHASWLGKASAANGFQPDRAFAERELGHLVSQVSAYRAEQDFDAIAVLQGFLLQGLVIATYDPFLDIARRYVGLSQVCSRALAEARHHVDWIARYLHLRFFDRQGELIALVQRVVVRGAHCVGAAWLSYPEYLTGVGLSGAACAGALTDEHAQLLQRAGVEERLATRTALGLVLPAARRCRGSRAEALG
jgi:hypothetical protein